MIASLSWLVGRLSVTDAQADLKLLHAMDERQ